MINPHLHFDPNYVANEIKTVTAIASTTYEQFALPPAPKMSPFGRAWEETLTVQPHAAPLSVSTGGGAPYVIRSSGFLAVTVAKQAPDADSPQTALQRESQWWREMLIAILAGDLQRFGLRKPWDVPLTPLQTIHRFIDGKTLPDHRLEQTIFDKVNRAQVPWEDVVGPIEDFQLGVLEACGDINEAKTRASIYKTVEALAKLHFATQEKFRSMGL